MSFVNRTEAGRRLARALADYRDMEPVVFALPRGGVPVAAEIAEAFSVPLHLLIVRKIGVPGQPELAAGAVVDAEHPIVVRNDDVIRGARVSEAEFEKAMRDEVEEIKRRRSVYVGERAYPEIKDRVVIVVDDGIATGATMRAALRGLRSRGPRQIVVATPVAPSETLNLFTQADQVVCLERFSDFGSIGEYYGDFRQVDDAEVIAALEKSRRAER